MVTIVKLTFILPIKHTTDYIIFFICTCNLNMYNMNPNYFSFGELINSAVAVKYGIYNIPEWSAVQNLYKLAKRLDKVRESFNSPIIVNSGYRCPKLNELVGGVHNSKHLDGLAADITVISDPHVPTLQVLNILYLIVKQFKWSECYINTERLYIHVAL